MGPAAKNNLSLRTSAHAGVAIPLIDVKFDFRLKQSENPGDCHASLRTGSQ